MKNGLTVWDQCMFLFQTYVMCTYCIITQTNIYICCLFHTSLNAAHAVFSNFIVRLNDTPLRTHFAIWCCFQLSDRRAKCIYARTEKCMHDWTFGCQHHCTNFRHVTVILVWIVPKYIKIHSIYIYTYHK